MIFSHGKLLLTSEYVVLDGALALALPTKWGQEFFVSEHPDGKSLINWTALHQGKFWLNAIIDYQNGKVVSTNIPESAAFVLKVLMKVKELSFFQLKDDSSYSIKTDLQFPANFGLGSSSTLMNNLAVWSEIDAFELNEKALGGSGYDIAVAQKKSAILYQLKENQRTITAVDFNPDFKNELIFVHLNQKQDSREGISMYRQKEKTQKLIDEFSELTSALLQTQNIDEFSYLMEIHEKKLSQFLNIPTAKEKYFSDIPVFIKSLGAWGGDFVMSRKFEGFEAYFNAKGFLSVFEWNDLIEYKPG